RDLDEARIAEDAQRRVLHARGRQPEAAGDEEHDDEAQPLRRHRVEAEASPEHALVGLRTASPGGDNAGRDTEHDREERPERDHRNRVLERLPEDVRHGLLGPERTAEVPLREVAEVDLVLLPLRLVETERTALVLLELLRALPAAERRHGVTRDRAEENE